MAGHAVVGGMVYLGTHLPSEDKRRIEPSLIDPTLPVEWQNPHWSNRGLDYYPSYDTITSQQRAAYLIWLDRGRRDREIPVAYAFLFLYGLERRLLDDLWNRTDHKDFIPILTEIEALHRAYGPSNKSFRKYTSNLLDFMEALHPGTPTNQRSMDGAQGVPYSLSRRMGEAAATGTRIAPEMALRYLRTHPDSQLGVAADRAYVEFDELFLSRYVERHGEGMALRPPRVDLRVQYQPSSAGLVCRTVALKGVPDINAGGAALHHVKSLANDCVRDLDAYSRFLGRQPDDADTPEAISLLPVGRMEAHRPQAVAAVRGWVDSMMADKREVLIESDDLLSRWAPDGSARKVHLNALARLLSGMDVGIEPDTRHQATGTEGQLVLFRCPNIGTASWPQSKEMGVLFSHLGRMAQAAGGLSEGGREFVLGHFEHRFRMSEAELSRVGAALTRSAAITDGHTRRRGQHRDEQERTDNMRLFVGFALCNREVGPEVIAALVKACGTFEIEETEVYRRLHSLPLEESGLVEARPPSEATEYAIDLPAETDDEPLGVVLDSNKLEQRLADTAHVYDLLGNVFIEADDMATPIPHQLTDAEEVGASATKDEHLVIGLDDAHGNLAAMLAQQPKWTLAEATAAASSMGLPLWSGAMDTINEAVIDICGEPLVEGDDPVTLNEYAVAEVMG